MSINSSDIKNISDDIHADYGFTGSAYDDPIQSQYGENFYRPNIMPDRTMSFHVDYLIPLKSIKSQVFGTESNIVQTIQGIEDSFLRNLYIDPSIDVDLYQAHQRIWQEASPYMGIPYEPTEGFAISKTDMPSYISFDEYHFAERSNSTASKHLITEFEEAISQATFSYFYQFRRLLNYLLSELTNIKLSLLTDFGEDYENEAQQKIAIRYDTWAKVALHYTRRVASTILSKPGEIPYAELDKITKKQAAQFQAFFAVRLNAVDEEINDLLSSIKRDLVDNGDIFYKRYITPTIRMTKDVADPLNFDYNTQGLANQIPFLAGEITLANNVIFGNFSSINADLVERFELFSARVDAVFMLIHEKRRFANYISQLSEKAVQKRKLLYTVSEDKYGVLFRSVSTFQMIPEKYKSSHGMLDDLEADWHPQYLLRDGGVISGDITVDPEVKIDGISLSKHAHSGADGSTKIKSSDIDYSSARSNDDLIGLNVSKPIRVLVDSFIPDIIDGGIPVFDTIIAIEIGDEVFSNHEYEIIYTEIE